MSPSTRIIWIGTDVHKDTVMVAVLEGLNGAAEIEITEWGYECEVMAPSLSAPTSPSSTAFVASVASARSAR